MLKKRNNVLPVKKTDIPLLKCAKCKCTYYCNRDCQLKDWKNHKVLCKKLHDINYLNYFYSVIVKKGVPIFTLGNYSKFVITNYSVFRKNIIKITDEYVKINDELFDKNGIKSVSLIKAGKPINMFSSYIKKVKKMGLTYESYQLDEWKNDIINFDIRNNLSKITKKNCIIVDNYPVWVENGKLLNPADDEKLIGLNNDYISSFKDVFEYIQTYSDKITIDTLIFDGNTQKDPKNINELCFIYHFIHDEDNKYTFIRGQIFYNDIILVD